MTSSALIRKCCIHIQELFTNFPSSPFVKSLSQRQNEWWFVYLRLGQLSWERILKYVYLLLLLLFRLETGSQGPMLLCKRVWSWTPDLYASSQILGLPKCFTMPGFKIHLLFIYLFVYFETRSSCSLCWPGICKSSSHVIRLLLLHRYWEYCWLIKSPNTYSCLWTCDSFIVSCQDIS